MRAVTPTRPDPRHRDERLPVRRARWPRDGAARGVALAAAAVLAVAGCTPGEPDATGPPTASSAPSGTSGPPDGGLPAPTSETALPEDDAPTDEPFPADGGPDTATTSGEPGLSPTGMRFGVHDGFDRVVIDLTGTGEPGWTAEYTDTPTADGSGAPVDLAGGAALEVRLEGVALPTEPGAAPWQGPEEIGPRSAGVVEQVRRGPLFEGTQPFFLGLASQQPYRVYALQDPTRVVIDVQHPELTGGDEPLPDADPAGDDAPFVANREPDVAEASDGARLSPVDLRFGVHDGFDRVVLDLTGPGRPGWLGEYVTEPTQAGSGFPVQLAGDASLQVHVRGVVYPTQEGAEEYEGPQRFRPGAAGVVEEVVYGAIYEGQLELYLGLSSDVPFRVFRLEDPARVVIDVQHPADTPPEDPADAQAPFPADRSPDTAQGDDAARLSPVDLRFGVHDGFDRIVLDLVGDGEPGWRGEYVDDPTQHAAGGPVYLLGEDYLRVLVRGVMLPTEPGAQPFEGPRTITPQSGGVVRDVRYGSLFEGQVEIWVGLGSAEPFRVFGLEDPTRVVIDVQHP